ncbi:hypothetical protein ACO1O0_001832 [Amphichorda felina]
MLWKGTQHLCFAPNQRGKFVSRRVEPLVYLPEAVRLKTIKVFVQETNPDYMRRRHETRAMIRHMANMTALQPNCRTTRSLRNLQGLDYIACLRGVKDISWFNFDEWLVAKEIAMVRDFTFQQDIMNQVSRDKSDVDHELSQWRRLTPLLEQEDPDSPNYYEPTNADWVVLEDFMDNRSTGPQQTDLPEEGFVPVCVQPVGAWDSDAIVISDSATSDDEKEDSISDSRSTPIVDSGVVMEMGGLEEHGPDEQVSRLDGDGVGGDAGTASGRRSESGLFVGGPVLMEVDQEVSTPDGDDTAAANTGVERGRSYESGLFVDGPLSMDTDDDGNEGDDEGDDEGDEVMIDLTHV